MKKFLIFLSLIAGLSAETLYVPAYSHIYISNTEEIYLGITLSIRNTDFKEKLYIDKVEYYDNDGNLIDDYIKSPLVLKGMASTNFVIKQSDKRGGSGANFIVKYHSEKPINEPIVESVMVGVFGTKGLAFNSRATKIDDK